jgi:hypothetical protein
MNPRKLIVLLLFIPFCAICQTKGVVRDSLSKAAIPYINIWVEQENVGTTSDEEGNFQLPKISKGKALIFSAIGYETRRVILDSSVLSVYLIPKRISLSEVVISAKSGTRKLVVGKYRDGQIKYYFGTLNSPLVFAKFFPYRKEYEEKPYLEQIKVATESDIDSALFHVRLYSVGADGQPGDYLYDQSITGIARKGKRPTRIDVADMNIRIPEEGLFVAIEWLIIDSNLYEYEGTGKPIDKSIRGKAKNKSNVYSYEPAVGVVASVTNNNSWMYTKGIWSRVFKGQSQSGNKEKKYTQLAIELTLTN